MSKTFSTNKFSLFLKIFQPITVDLKGLTLQLVHYITQIILIWWKKNIEVIKVYAT